MLKAEFSLTPTNDTSVHPVIMSDVNKIDGKYLIKKNRQSNSQAPNF